MHCITKILDNNVKGVKKVRSAIKLCSYYFSYNVSLRHKFHCNSLKSTNLLRNKKNGMYNQIFCHGKMILKIKYPSEIFGLEEQNVGI